MAPVAQLPEIVAIHQWFVRRLLPEAVALVDTFIRLGIEDEIFYWTLD